MGITIANNDKTWAPIRTPATPKNENIYNGFLQIE